jgi:enolase
MIIKEVRARKISDSRGEKTIEVSVGNSRASSPSGKSKGKHETPSYHNSLDWNIKAINSLNKIMRKNPLAINNFAGLIKVESLITRTFGLKNIKQFGANALFALESAILKALATSQGKELWQIVNPLARKIPIPLGNAIGGGMHSEKFKVHPTFQEFLIIPHKNSIRENVRVMNEVYNKLKRATKARAVNDEGALQTNLGNEAVLKLLEKFRNKVHIGLDIAASSFYCKGEYIYQNEILDKNAQIFYINLLIKDYKLDYVEDALEENDFKGFSKISKRALVCGDDLTATHLSRLKEAITNKSINAMIIKPNQNGSLIELAEIFKLCKSRGIKTILSHRSGETMDSALADYAFGFGADFIKTGIATRWREAKLKRLIDIEKSLK